MGLEFLVRVRRVSLAAAAIATLIVATYVTPLAGLGLACGAAWSLINLALLQTLIVSVISPAPMLPPAARRAGFALLGLLALVPAGAWLLFHTPALWLTAGFSLPLLAIVFKAGSRAVLESRAWAALTRSPWRAAALIAALLVIAWWALPAAFRTERAASASGRAATPAVAGAMQGAEAAAKVEGAVAKAEGQEESGSQKFPNALELVTRAFPHQRWAQVLHHYEAVVFALFVGLMLCVVGFIASRNPQMVPGPLQNGAEALVEQLYDFVVGILGPSHGPRFFPFLGAIFVYIFAMNLFGIVPLMDSPTSNLSVTFALGLTVFVYVQYVGVRSLGVVGYLDHMLGSPRNLTGWILAPLMFPIHVLGELAKPISLSCRLFGNIFGEDMLMVGFATLGIGMLSFAHLPIGMPMHAIFFPLVLLTSGLQAFVFTVLSTIYILLMLPHEEHGHEEAAHPAH
jgi:F-type H+-transporting ATPase subunit a